MVIIAKGKLVATDTVGNLTSRLRGAETVALEVLPRDASADLAQFAQAVQTKLEQVTGVSRVTHKESKDGRTHFTVESQKDSAVRPELARAVVESGWHLNELHGVGLSLEEIFLELTASKDTAAPSAPAAEPETTAAEEQK